MPEEGTPEEQRDKEGKIKAATSNPQRKEHNTSSNNKKISIFFKKEEVFL